MRSFLNILKVPALLAALCFAQASLAATGMPRYGVFVFSNFCVSPMSDDLGGNRITLRRLADGDTLVYEYTDGSTHAMMAKSFTLDATSGALQFTVDAEAGPASTVSGNIAHDGQSVTLHGFPFQGDTRQTLLRVTNFAARTSACKPLHSAR